MIEGRVFHVQWALAFCVECLHVSMFFKSSSHVHARCGMFGGTPNRAVACDVTSAAFNQNAWQNVWYLYRERRVFNFSVVVERVTAKPLWHDNCLSVGTNILEG